MGVVNFKWTEEPLTMMKRLIDEAFSAKETAAKLSVAFDADITRNAVIGKAHRLGWHFKSVPVVAAPVLPAKKKAVSVASNVSASDDLEEMAKMQMLMPFIAEMPLPLSSEIAIPMTDRVTIDDLTNSTCRFPISRADDEWSFCGAEGADLAGKKPYCAHHAAIAYRPKPREQSVKSNAERRIWALKMAARKMAIAKGKVRAA